MFLNKEHKENDNKSINIDYIFLRILSLTISW